MYNLFSWVLLSGHSLELVVIVFRLTRITTLRVGEEGRSLSRLFLRLIFSLINSFGLKGLMYEWKYEYSPINIQSFWTALHFIAKFVFLVTCHIDRNLANHVRRGAKKGNSDIYIQRYVAERRTSQWRK